jgi:tetratricopeptide (TPR) repeat protein
LQGKAWALYGEDGWFDFRPGMLLENLWSVYTPAEPEKEAFKVANSAYRFSLSRCFKESHSVATCNTCHDSHGMVQTSAVEFNRQNCQKCHPPESLPGSGSKFAHSAADDCVSCHMKQTGTQNTLHGVMNTDHWIRVDAKQTVIDWSPYRLPAERQPTMALVPFLDTRDTGKDLRRGIAYLDYFRNYDDRKPYLDSALAYLTIGLTTVGDDARGFLHLGEVQSELELYDAAIKSLLRATELRSEYPEVYYQLGRVYTAVGNLDSALHYYQLAVKYLPDEPSYLEGLGMVLAERGYNDEAVATLEKALRIDKQNPETYAFLGNLYAISLNQPRKALPYFNQRAILDPDIPDVYINLGNTYTLLGDYEEAVKSYQREIYYRPRSVGAFVNLSRVYVVMGRETDAWKALQKAVKIDPSVVMLADFAKLYEERSQKR